jgi:hypothetical protein
VLDTGSGKDIAVWRTKPPIEIGLSMIPTAAGFPRALYDYPLKMTAVIVSFAIPS